MKPGAAVATTWYGGRSGSSAPNASGVSAGIDMSLYLVGRLWGPGVARTVQKGIEYFPEPPYQEPSLRCRRTRKSEPLVYQSMSPKYFKPPATPIRSGAATQSARTAVT